MKRAFGGLLLGSVLACGGGGGFEKADAGGGQDGSPVVSTGGAALSVNGVAAYTALGGVSASKGAFVVVSVTLANTGSDAALATNPLFFSLGFPNHTLVLASPMSSSLKDACDASVSVAASGSVSCSVAFDVAATATPDSIVYADPSGPSSSAPIGAIPPASPPNETAWGALSASDRATVCASVAPSMPTSCGAPMHLDADRSACSDSSSFFVWPLEQVSGYGGGCDAAEIDPKCPLGTIKACIAAVNANACASFSDASCSQCLSWTVSDPACH